MRIGFVSTFPPIECGIATYTYDLENALRMQNHETFIIAPPGAKGSNVHIALSTNGAAPFAEQAFNVACTQTPDCIHVQHEFGLYGAQRGVEIIGFLTRCSIAGIPTVTTLHTVNSDFPHTEREIIRRIATESRALIVHEPEQRRILHRFAPEAADRIHVIPHGVRNTAPIARAKQKLGLSGKKVVLLCGYYRPSKGFHRALNFMPDVFRQFPDTLLVLAGKTRNAASDHYRQELVEQFRQAGCSNRIRVFHGQFPQYTFDALISAADVVAMPYERGAQSGIMAQCIAMETPVVASDLPAFVNAVGKTGAGLIASSDEAFSHQIIRLLSDSALRKNTLKNIRRFKQRNAWVKIALQHESIYTGLLPAGTEYIYLPPPDAGGIPENIGLDTPDFSPRPSGGTSQRWRTAHD
ncbi:glycosyltransferase [Verrucomicrobia bacterium S94]|nr:glycosyltransferase [Verrucomicrobia bacterium S94]